MTIIAAYYYNEGKRVREIALDERIELGESRSGFCWIALSEPTDDELRAIQTTYNLHPLAIDNAMHPLCPPKLEVYNDELYIVAQTAELVGDRISYGKMAIFTGHNHLITVRHGNAGALGKLRAQLEASPTQFGKGVDYVLHAILHRVVDQYLPIFEMIEDDVLAMERRSLHAFLGPEEVARIFELRSELTRFQRTLGAMAELVRKLVRGHFPCISAEMTHISTTSRTMSTACSPWSMVSCRFCLRSLRPAVFWKHKGSESSPASSPPGRQYWRSRRRSLEFTA